MADKAYAAHEAGIASYVEALLEPEDDVLAEIRARSGKEGLPTIAVGPFDGRHLEVIARATGAMRMVEIGTLGGYSGVCLARALPDGGRLDTFELDEHHAKVAEESFRRAGVASKVRIPVGPALERLGAIEGDGPFDLVFLDADKEGYPAYLDWTERHLRVGGTLLADNVFRKPRGREAAEVVHAFNERLARSYAWRLTMIPVEDGLAFAVKTG